MGMKTVNYRLTAWAILLLGNVTTLLAQKTIPFSSKPEKNDTRLGNQEFSKGNYADAEAQYKKALDRKNNMPEAAFNLGDAVYKQKRYEEAEKQFQLCAQNNVDPIIKAKSYHNLGNTYLEQEKWKEAVDAYKNALKNNANDAETKYNLAYANAKLKAQQNGGDGKDNKNQDKKEQENKDQKQNENKDNKGDKKEEQNNEQKDQKGDQKKQGEQPRLSKEEAEKLLQAIENEEQKTNQKMQQKTVKGQMIKVEKDW
jgi:tetratricopeptide (TPR) repeat protein